MSENTPPPVYTRPPCCLAGLNISPIVSVIAPLTSARADMLLFRLPHSGRHRQTTHAQTLTSDVVDDMTSGLGYYSDYLHIVSHVDVIIPAKSQGHDTSVRMPGCGTCAVGDNRRW